MVFGTLDFLMERVHKDFVLKILAEIKIFEKPPVSGKDMEETNNHDIYHKKLLVHYKFCNLVVFLGACQIFCNFLILIFFPYAFNVPREFNGNLL